VIAPKRGFTLIEVLVSIAVGSLLLALLSQVLITVREGWERSMEFDQELVAEALAREAITRTLKAGVSTGANNGGGGLRGTETELELVVMPPQSALALGRLQVRLVAERQADGSYKLVLALKPLAQGTGATPRSLRERWVLLEGLKSLRFEYSGPPDEQPKSHWGELAVAPDLVALHGVYKDHARKPFWIAVRPRMAVPAECLLDWTSLTCRAS